MQAKPRIRNSTEADIGPIAALYRAVGSAGGGLARTPGEVTLEYVTDFVTSAQHGGIQLVADAGGGSIAGEIHAYPPGPAALAHVLGELTIAVHPDWQGRGVGRALFSALLERVEGDFPHIVRVELKARETNSRAIRLYETLGFQKEGRMLDRIRLEDGSLDADIPMAWHRQKQSG